MLNSTEILTLDSVFEPIFKKIILSFLKICTTLTLSKLTFCIFLKEKMTYTLNTSKYIWWKNCLCLDGAFSKLIVFFFSLRKCKDTTQPLKKIFEKSKKIVKFLTKIVFLNLFCLIDLLILKLLLKTVFIFNIYNFYLKYFLL